MKARFTNIDIVAAVREIQGLIGLRVTNVYDVDHKIYLFKFSKPDSKVVLLIESGIRLHTTEFEWPKSSSPSGFSMKLRKHIRNRRLEVVTQLGVDRIVDMQFGSREAAYHIILELYDRGNIILTDHEYNVLNILRPRTDQDTDVRYAVHETYPLQLAKQWQAPPDEIALRELFQSVQKKDAIKKLLNTRLYYGSALVEHVLLFVELAGNMKVDKNTDLVPLLPKILLALQLAEKIYKEAAVEISKGFVTYKVEEKIIGENKEQCQVYEEFHPYFFQQLAQANVLEKPTFLNAVDEFYSKIESQRLDMSILDQQKQALKKLENVQKDHEKRLDALRRTQEKEELQARLIEENVDLVGDIIVFMRTLMAAELSWPQIAELLERRREKGEVIAEHVINANIASNTVTILLENKGNKSDDEGDEDVDDIIKVDINLNQSAFQNISRLHRVKKNAAAKETKTIEASGMALKNAERKTMQALKEVATIGSITKARKTQWFEKFFWFISSENYLVIGGRDAQQNEIIVKRYMKATDFYVHADLHGASSVIVKNPAGGPPPPKTLNEAGVMAVAYSGAWEAKMPSKAWWVFSHQVTKTAPTGEYLGTGSFMIRGRKNFFPALPMIMGFGVLFKIDEESMRNHVRESREESESVITDTVTEDVDLELGIDSGDDHDEKEADPDNFPETGEGFNFMRALASKIMSTSTSDEAEESTLITATNAWHQPKAPPTKAPIKASETIDKGKFIMPPGKTIPKTEGGVQKAPKVEKDDHDWSDYKKKRGKMRSRPVKNYEEKHQGLPAKVSSKKGAKKQDLEGVEDNPAKDNAEHDDDTKANDGLQIPEPSSTAVTENRTVSESNDQSEPLEQPPVDDHDGEEDAEEIDVGTVLAEDAQILASFEGAPLPTDTILYCVPVCAPYLAMQNYKFRVKLVPGTAKRGKAAKACFQSFLKDKTLTPQEKDTLKSLKDQDMSRNFPGSVKVAVQEQKNKNKKK